VAMGLVARAIFGLVHLRARKGLAVPGAAGSAKEQARAVGVRGETYAYWYLRRHGYVIVARNYSVSGVKGEIDLVGYDGPVLAFVEVKTRTGDRALPEEAITPEKRRSLARIAQRFLFDRRIAGAPYRFDVLAIESRPGGPPAVRLHKDAFPGAA
jgi:putative endonuclease